MLLLLTAMRRRHRRRRVESESPALAAACLIIVAVPRHHPLEATRTEPDHGSEHRLLAWRRVVRTAALVLEGVQREPQILRRKTVLRVVLETHRRIRRHRGRCREERLHRVGDEIGVLARTQLRPLELKSVPGLRLRPDVHLSRDRNIRVIFRVRLRVSSGVPGRELGELVNGGFSLFDEPVDGFTGAVVAQPVLNVVELDCGVGGEADPAVARAFGCVDLAVAVFPAGGADNVAALDLDDLAASDDALHSHVFVSGGGGADDCPSSGFCMFWLGCLVEDDGIYIK